MSALKVLPSQRQGMKPKLYGVWVCLHKHHGWVLTGNCTCMADLGSACSHVAAVLYKLEPAVHFELNKPTASTSMLCSWKPSKRNVQPSPAALINFARPKKTHCLQNKKLKNVVLITLLRTQRYINMVSSTNLLRSCISVILVVQCSVVWIPQDIIENFPLACRHIPLMQRFLHKSYPLPGQSSCLFERATAMLACAFTVSQKAKMMATSTYWRIS